MGTIAFIIEEEALLVRVARGWQYISVSRTHLDMIRYHFPIDRSTLFLLILFLF